MRLAWSAPVLRRAFVAASIAWATVLPLAPFAVSRPHPGLLVYSLAAAVYAVGALVCHQLPSRSFRLWDVQLPVCARCTGIYAGGAATALTALLRRGRPGRAPGSPFDWRAALVVSALPTGATLAYEWTTGITPANWIRFVAGAPIGATVAALVVAATRNQVN